MIVVVIVVVIVFMIAVMVVAKVAIVVVVVVGFIDVVRVMVLIKIIVVVVVVVVVVVFVRPNLLLLPHVFPLLLLYRRCSSWGAWRAPTWPRCWGCTARRSRSSWSRRPATWATSTCSCR